MGVHSCRALTFALARLSCQSMLISSVASYRMLLV